MSEQRKTYTAEFKRAAIKLVTEQGRSIREAARSLGVSEKQLRTWKRSLEEQGEHRAKHAVTAALRFSMAVFPVTILLCALVVGCIALSFFWPLIDMMQGVAPEQMR